MGDYSRTMLDSLVDFGSIAEDHPQTVTQSLDVTTSDLFKNRLNKAWQVVEKNERLKHTFITKDSLVRHLLGLGLVEFLGNNKG